MKIRLQLNDAAALVDGENTDVTELMERIVHGRLMIISVEGRPLVEVRDSGELVCSHNGGPLRTRAVDERIQATPTPAESVG